MWLTCTDNPPATDSIGNTRLDEENPSAEIEDSDQSTGQAPPDSIGKTNPDPAESTADVTPPISFSKSTTLSPAPALVTTVAAAKASPSTPSSSVSSSTGISGTDSTNIIAGADPRKVPSRLSMTYPKPNQANPPLFAIGNSIDFTWEFDKPTLTAPPANLTLQITLNSDATMVWPIANISGTATSYTWNTANIRTPSNLLMGMYTLNIFDAKIGKLGAANGGQLIPNSDLRFGLYVPESRIPGANKVQCGTCELASSSAPLYVQRQVIIPFLIANIMTLVMTFT
ncbi:hypothetical protein KI688_005185 [Linnemannia hyalina]|uniref:DUF7137 domain-containing protein n=1 Tax=Linnemannia hyalina TaxID=64524 RepID=A0A9P7XML3_9FUNG|nr:hypothetical protein KI688_005185 [Linnemannia hyalina]